MSATIAEPAEREHPWSRLYAEQGRERPQLINFTRRAAPETEPATASTAAALPAKIEWNDPPPEVDLVSTASLERLAAEIEARRCRDRLGMYKLLGFAAGVVLAVVLAIEAWQFFGNDRPPPERLLAQATAVGNEVLALHSSRAQPFALESVRAELQSAPDPRRLAYEIVVVLRLQENLFGPADSNGAQAYLRMQQSVREAGDRMRRHRLYLHNPAVAEQTPMPLLLAVTHRAGERLEVRVPLAARRVGWAWRMDARPELMRTVGASFGGRVLAQFADTPYLIFGTPEARERMRPLIDHGRRFVLAVNAELEARGRRGGAGVGAN